MISLDNTVVVNKYADSYDIDITRQSSDRLYANPYKIGIDGTRKQVLLKFEQYARSRYTYEDLLYLKGKRLGCVCKPKDCHGDIYILLMKENNIIEELF